MTATPLAPMAEEEQPKKKRRKKSPPAPPVNHHARKEATRLRQSAALTIRAAIQQLENASPTNLLRGSGHLELRRLKLAYDLLSARSVPTADELESKSGAGLRHRRSMERKLDAILSEIRGELEIEVDPSG